MNNSYNVLEEAAKFALSAHRNQFRKKNKIPAVIHSMEVAAIVSQLTDDIDVMAAALLHDTVEDTKASMDEIYEIFGEKIGNLVKLETENKRHGIPEKETWLIRKQESLEELRNSDDINVKILWLADKLSNMRSFYKQYNIVGDSLWNDFNQNDVKLQRWYYTEVKNMTSELKDTEVYSEYSYLLSQIFETGAK